MERFRQWTSSLVARVDWMVSQVENHEAVAKGAIRDVRTAAARARVQLARVHADGERLRSALAEQREAERVWRERARTLPESDESRALECLRRARRAKRRAEELEGRAGEHERVEKQLKSDVALVEERLHKLEDQHNLLRTRESRAQALSSVRDANDQGVSDIDELFERWETRVTEREFEGHCVTGSEDLDHFKNEWDEADESEALRDELRHLRSQDGREVSS